MNQDETIFAMIAIAVVAYLVGKKEGARTRQIAVIDDPMAWLSGWGSA